VTSIRSSDAILNDPSLSFTALGIWTYLFGQGWPGGALPTVEKVIGLNRGDPDEIREALSDLQTRGFLRLDA
jgi:hypothetical protein